MRVQGLQRALDWSQAGVGSGGKRGREGGARQLDFDLWAVGNAVEQLAIIRSLSCSLASVRVAAQIFQMDAHNVCQKCRRVS